MDQEKQRKELTLQGKYIIQGKIKAKTGLHIGGPTTGLNIGGVDNLVIKDVHGKPYIPGSSIKGKMRSLLEKSEGLAGDSERIWVVEDQISIHMCDDLNCIICNIFGRTGGKHKKFINKAEIEIRNVTPTRLIVRDAVLGESSLQEVKERLDLEWTEVKWENVIDRVTSAATPRPMERVPPGAVFGTDNEPFEMIYNVFDGQDKQNLKYVFKAMELLEHDYLGGSGSRGYGKIEFQEIKVFWNSTEDYENGTIDLTDDRIINKEHNKPTQIVKNFSCLVPAKQG